MRKTFGEVVLFARTGLNPRTNFKLGQGTNKYITIKNIHNNTLVIDDSTDVIDDDAITMIHRRSQIKAGDVLFCSIGRIGDMYIIEEEPVGWDVNESVFVFTLDTSIIRQKYFYYLFKHHDIIAYLTANSSGSTFKSIKMNQLQKMVFDLPSLEEQDTIVTCLDSTAEIIESRQRQLRALDTLIKARFVEMFGDPVSNPKGWRVIPWEGVFDTKTGKLDSNAAVEGGEYPFFTCAKEWLWIDKYAYDCEALLLAGNNAAGVYDVKHYKGKFNAYQRTYILQLKDADWSYSLFKYQLEDRLQYLQSQSKGTNTRYLTMGILNSLTFIVPPKELQDEFTTLVSQVDKSKVAIQAALEKAQLLFDSLMQQYFN